MKILEVFGSQATEGCNFEESSPTERKERRSWSPIEDVVLISSWLNTSKDPVVGNEQRSVSFWKRIAATPVPSLLDVKRGSRLSASKDSTGSMTCNHKKKFTLEHAWKELCNDQKWSELSTAKNDGSSKKRKVDDASQSESSQAIETDDERTNRPRGVKASKAGGKKAMVDGKEVAKFQTMWTIKKQDLEIKEMLPR
ncbi:PREDICTED: glutathione S-transferase T3-like [Brassica oleracea var. oleracea]|uniref:glutathione S-transferase T3-like n=1 Tax=Brassica oleracea var. oleracea TaxID=109376 RepID=UPI0006A6A962|nr:PREDICTED: glutathione S-transferase T3-like [Brassica oleracea var. oleracea]